MKFSLVSSVTWLLQVGLAAAGNGNAANQGVGQNADIAGSYVAEYNFYSGSDAAFSTKFYFKLEEISGSGGLYYAFNECFGRDFDTTEKGTLVLDGRDTFSINMVVDGTFFAFNGLLGNDGVTRITLTPDGGGSTFTAFPQKTSESLDADACPS